VPRAYLLRGRVALGVPIAVFGALTAVREGALGGTAQFDLSLFRSWTNQTWNQSSSWSENHSGPTPMRVASSSVRCDVVANGSIGDGFSERFRCSDDPSARVSAHVDLRAEPPFCF
jgi:hypothetical protein